MPRITATLLIALHAAAQLASGQTMPPNRANSTVPYESECFSARVLDDLN